MIKMLQSLVIIICFLGIFCGYLLRKIAKEEIKFGKFGNRYFIWLRRLILFILILILLYLTKNYLVVIIFVVIGFLIGVYLDEYLFLGSSLVISFISNNLLFLVSGLVFINGLVYGSFLRNLKKGIFSLLFFIPLFLLFFNFNYYDYLIGLSCGGLLSNIIKK